MKKIIKFNSKEVKGLHFFIDGMSFPILVGTFNDREEVKISYLINTVKNRSYNVEDICYWCMNHNIQYQFICFIHKKEIINNPRKYYRYLLLKWKLKKMKQD